MVSPYSDLNEKAFWRRAVADLGGDSHSSIYEPKWPITRNLKVSTAGSCFAQHIGKRLHNDGFTVLDMEPAPQWLPKPIHSVFGYGIYSARYGNIYTARQMLQLSKEAFGERNSLAEVWEKNGRYYDPLRPTIEPDGFSSPEVVLAHRKFHLEMVRILLIKTELLVFTLGLTEAWIDIATGTVLPTCPGVVAGEFNPTSTAFHQFSFAEILEDLKQLRDLLRHRGKAKLLLTVSPVPLTATASAQHVMQATVHSKAVLRAAVGEMSLLHDDVDYFPSFEIIANPWRQGSYYEPNFRSVSKHGVDTVMASFMSAHGVTHPQPAQTIIAANETQVVTSDSGTDVICDEELLDVFGPQ